ncbi:hypothetical protein NM688_g8265 [Phlebia brevispora]|uniref:Uncharacterized protein n=1 Tax=Phlebia brevispora TaxID=194682 RepID=A0ACC1RV61_9APHY|nr:hypothetical protein NM688_g8265 [Phlebia brevispora]
MEVTGTSTTDALRKELTTVPNKRPGEEDVGDGMACSGQKRQKTDEENKADAPAELKTGESSKLAEEQAPVKQKRKDQSRRAAKEKREQERALGKRRGTRPEGEPKADNGESKGPRLPKRMSAILLGFCGAGYNGMQMCALFMLMVRAN